MAELIDSPDFTVSDVPVLPLHRLLLKPWERKETGGDTRR
jgi:hypothetical protein